MSLAKEPRGEKETKRKGRGWGRKEVRKPLLMNEGKAEIINKRMKEKRNALTMWKRKAILKDSTLTVV